MRKDLTREIELPEGFSASFNDDVLTINGNGKKIVKEFNFHKINNKVEDNKIILFSKGATRREAKQMGTFNAHMKNMIRGLKNEFVYTMEICNVHFPMNVKVEGDKVVIKSFLGETTKRVAKILPDTKVDIKGSQITISSLYIENAGQTAGNIEKASKLKGRDRRIFQDGIFITDKCGRKI